MWQVGEPVDGVTAQRGSRSLWIVGVERAAVRVAVVE